MKNKIIVWSVGALLGGTAGFLYWYNIGCLTGSCPIQSDPLNSSVYGMLLGGLSADILRDAKTSFPEYRNTLKAFFKK